jgi:glutamate dehydrogenase/leucine dehydrogenase
MEKLDIDWLHRENKEGRRSGRTVEMLAEAIGTALVANIDTEIYIVCAPGNEISVWHEFMDVFREIAPGVTYFRNTYNDRPTIFIPMGGFDVKVVFQNYRMVSRKQTLGGMSGKPFDELEFIDHAFFEYNKNMEHRRMSVRPRPGNINRNPLFFSNLPPYRG